MYWGVCVYMCEYVGVCVSKFCVCNGEGNSAGSPLLVGYVGFLWMCYPSPFGST